MHFTRILAFCSMIALGAAISVGGGGGAWAQGFGDDASIPITERPIPPASDNHRSGILLSGKGSASVLGAAEIKKGKPVKKEAKAKKGQKHKAVKKAAKAKKKSRKK